MTDIMKTIADNLRAIREEQGLTRAEVARRAGIARYSYQRLELGESAWISTLACAAQALGVTLADVVQQRKPK